MQSMPGEPVGQPTPLIKKCWRPTPLFGASIALHGAALGAVAIRPHVWPWALGAIAADHLLLTAVGLWPRSMLLGSNWTCLPEVAATRHAVALTIDDGPHPDITPRVLELLDEHGAKATFFCVGEKVRRYPEIARDILERGHAVENHTQRHLHNFSLLGPRGLLEEVGRAQESIAAVTGLVPRFFRAPAGLRNPFLDPVLTRLDLQLASWTRRGFDTVSRDPGAVLEKLTRRLGGGDILLLHDGQPGRHPSGHPIIIEVLPKLLAAVSAAGLHSVTLRAALT